MSYCAIEEAFSPLVPGTSSKKSKKTRAIVVPAAPADQETKEMSLVDPNEDRDPDRPAQRPPPANDILSSPPSSSSRLESMGNSDFFPMQGGTAEPEAWQKAFMLGGMSSSVPKPSFAVQDQPTLWRSIPKKVDVPVEALGGTDVESLAPIRLPDDMNRRLDALTRQLDALTTSTPMQNTAELFLFVAIGLLLLLAMDTLLRYATTILGPSSSTPLQVMSGGYSGRGRGFRMRR